jgi:phosphatidylserine/phosphatidylglycerophosphate/cardiolipin synthase-like enzyme
MNFDNRSLALNDEATLMVRDRTFGQRMNEIFMADLTNAEPITAGPFDQRSWIERIAEQAAGLFTRLL